LPSTNIHFIKFNHLAISGADRKTDARQVRIQAGLAPASLALSLPAGTGILRVHQLTINALTKVRKNNQFAIIFC